MGISLNNYRIYHKKEGDSEKYLVKCNDAFFTPEVFFGLSTNNPLWARDGEGYEPVEPFKVSDSVFQSFIQGGVRLSALGTDSYYRFFDGLVCDHLPKLDLNILREFFNSVIGGNLASPDCFVVFVTLIRNYDIMLDTDEFFSRPITEKSLIDFIVYESFYAFFPDPKISDAVFDLRHNKRDFKARVHHCLKELHSYSLNLNKNWDEVELPPEIYEEIIPACLHTDYRCHNEEIEKTYKAIKSKIDVTGPNLDFTTKLLIGHDYIYGSNGSIVDYDKAFSILSSIGNESPRALELLGEMYYQGYCTKDKLPDYEQARNLFEMAEKDFDPFACNLASIRLADMKFLGLGGFQPDAQAYKALFKYDIDIQSMAVMKDDSAIYAADVFYRMIKSDLALKGRRRLLPYNLYFMASLTVFLYKQRLPYSDRPEEDEEHINELNTLMTARRLGRKPNELKPFSKTMVAVQMIKSNLQAIHDCWQDFTPFFSGVGYKAVQSDEGVYLTLSLDEDQKQLMRFLVCDLKTCDFGYASSFTLFFKNCTLKGQTEGKIRRVTIGPFGISFICYNRFFNTFETAVRICFPTDYTDLSNAQISLYWED